MGTFSVSVDVGDPTAERFETIDAVVDTGASYTMLPESMLRRLSVTPHAQRRFQLASGEPVVRDIGRTWVRLDGRSEITIVIFGDDAARPPIGAVTLEEFGLAVDPMGRRLTPVDGLLL